MRISDWSSDVCSSDLVVPNLFLNETGFHLASSSFLDVAAASLIASALSILLQILNRWGIGSGYYYPLQATPTVFAVMFLASNHPGGLDRKSTRLNYSH